jgi:hypothetical protein
MPGAPGLCGDRRRLGTAHRTLLFADGETVRGTGESVYYGFI